MARLIVAFLVVALAWAEAAGRGAVVADSLSRVPLSGASVFDRDGRFAGITDQRGRVSGVSDADYPIAIRYLGYAERSVATSGADTIWLRENPALLPEVVVETKRKKMLHILAYAREYSTLATYTDTVTMFREKMVDFMLPADGNEGARMGWSEPRVLNSRSYYRFTNSEGLDSVGDKCNQHFTWSDWVGVLPSLTMPAEVAGAEESADTVRGRYSPAEIWRRRGHRVSLDIDVLADSAGRRMVPRFSHFFRRPEIDFERFRLRLNYANVSGDRLTLDDLEGFSFNIESRGRGSGVFHFNRVDEPFFVTTYTEVYILDKEYIPMKEARKWERLRPGREKIEIVEPAEAPALQPSVRMLVERVNMADTDQARLDIRPDHLLMGRVVRKRNFAERTLQLLKVVTGISRVRMHRNNEREWREFRSERIRHNMAAPADSVK